MPDAQNFAFTLKADGIKHVLNSDAWVSGVFDSSGSPDKQIFKKYNAIWDTGATGSVITRKVIEECGLEPIGITKVYTASGSRLSEVYYAAILLPNKVRVSPVKVTEGDIHLADVLIGMDIISLGDFAATNKDEKTTFSFKYPSTECIDFAKLIRSKSESRPKVGRNVPCPCGSGKKYKNCCGK